jgi:hypothetical protein
VQRWLEASEITRGAVFRAVDRYDNVSRERRSESLDRTRMAWRSDANSR